MKKNYAFWGVFAIVLLALGFTLGRCTTKPIESIEYIKGETIRDSIPYPVPVLVEVPINPNLPLKRDTVRIESKVYISESVDTAQIIAEYIKRNTYAEVLFDRDSLGKLTVNAIVQYNQLQQLGYEFTPVTKKVTVEKRKFFTPFIIGSANTLGMFGAGGGLYINNFGLGAKYVTDFNRTGFEVFGAVKF